MFFNGQTQLDCMTDGIQYVVLIAGILLILFFMLILASVDINALDLACEVFGTPSMSRCG
jgi:uncharacterized integral membrane protein